MLMVNRHSVSSRMMVLTEGRWTAKHVLVQNKCLFWWQFPFLMVEGQCAKLPLGGSLDYWGPGTMLGSQGWVLQLANWALRAWTPKDNLYLCSFNCLRKKPFWWRSKPHYHRVLTFWYIHPSTAYFQLRIITFFLLFSIFTSQNMFVTPGVSKKSSLLNRK